VLDRTEVQSRLHLPPDQQFSRPESELVRALYDCPDVPVGPTGQRCRVVVATHPATAQKSRIGLTRSGLVYELFTALPQSAFTAADVVALYLHRGAYAPTLADEDQEQDPNRWCSHSAAGKPAWQVISQWVWNAPPGNWGINWSRPPCAPPSLLPPGQRRLKARLPLSAMLPLRLACPGKPGGSPGAILLLKRMVRCAAQQARACMRPKSAAKRMAGCECSSPPGSETVAAVSCASNVSGTGRPRRNHVG